MSDQIDVALRERSYRIHVGGGVIANAPAFLAPFVRGAIAVVTDSNVAAVHLQPFLEVLRGSGIETRSIVLDPGEQAKSFRGLENLIDQLLDSGIDRSGLVVALGGGVIGDLAGFAAGVHKRGIAHAQIPTTLLAQVDSSVGGKTAINTSRGKNLVGLFHQPAVVIADTDLLRTLPRRELIAGYAEVAKYGALGDADFLAWLENHGANALEGDSGALARMVAHACRMKAAIVSRDERETGDRALLNLGHTFGHALEAATGYSDRLFHGEAVSIGMVLALQLSAQLGYAPVSDVDRLERHLHSVSLPVRIADIAGARPDVETLMSHMMHDKKLKDGRLNFVLVRGLGQAFVTDAVPVEILRALLAE
ncbi:MAG TPA: 3-dehydroquinate synthase [Rhizomicrobium sp.]|jgi:3-dehydroquinate synthase|nr:3-dehydroquinate synthase [Rhizomicrobium sp.]